MLASQELLEIKNNVGKKIRWYPVHQRAVLGTRSMLQPAYNNTLFCFPPVYPHLPIQPPSSTVSWKSNSFPKAVSDSIGCHVALDCGGL
jgi:Zn-finger protein